MQPADPGMTAKTLIIGYGSPIRGDDAIGPLTAEALMATPLPREVHVIARHILTAELAAEIATAERVIFLDASVTGEPGEVRVQTLAPDASTLSSMAHFLSPRELLAWCQALYGHRPAAWMVTATGQSFTYAHCRLSPLATAAMETMLAEVKALIGRSGTGISSPTFPPTAGPAPAG